MHAKRGGKMKRKEGGKVEGEKCMPRADRKRRASGGSAESNPFTAAHKGTPARGREIERMSEGSDRE